MMMFRGIIYNQQIRLLNEDSNADDFEERDEPKTESLDPVPMTINTTISFTSRSYRENVMAPPYNESRDSLKMLSTPLSNNSMPVSLDAK